jgi:hypothetical protein
MEVRVVLRIASIEKFLILTIMVSLITCQVHVQSRQKFVQNSECLDLRGSLYSEHPNTGLVSYSNG